MCAFATTLHCLPFWEACVRVLEPNEVLSERYRIDRQIGAGGMGAVYLAQHLKLEMPVAVKTCHLGLNITPNDLPDYFKRFKREAKALTKLKHTNIIGVIDYDVIDNTPFLVMEYFKGLSVLGWGEERRPTPQQWLKVFRPLFEALAVAHRAGIVHRDIKGPNVLVRGDVDAPEVMLIDWGVAFDESLSGLTQQDAVVGSPGCIDPARYFGASYTPLSDIYSMGALMYWALTGQPAIVAKTGQSKHEANAQNHTIPPHEVNPAVTGDLEEFLLAMLETEPGNRPPSALACAAILDALDHGADVEWEAIYNKYPQKPFLPAADVDGVELRSNVELGELTKRVRPETRNERAVEVSLSNVGEVVVDAPIAPPAKASPIAMLDRNLADLGVRPNHSRRWRVIAASCAAFALLVVAFTLFSRRDVEPNGQLAIANRDSTLGALVTPDDIERAAKATPAALEQVLQGKKNEDRLDQFSPDIRARYPTTPTAANDTVAEATKAKKKAETPEVPALTLGIMPAAVPGKTEAAEQLTIPHGTRSSAFLLDLLDTSNGEPVRAELRSSLRLNEKVVIPVGSVLIGSAALRDELRATANFTRVVFRDGREFPIRAAAILKDGREGISGGQFEYGDSAKKSEGPSILAEVAGGAALDVAGLVLPGADAVSRGGKNAIARESSKARDRRDDGPHQRDRMIVNRGAELLIQFRSI